MFRYELTEEQKDYVARNMSIFDNDPPGIGRLLSNAHTRKMLHQPVQVGTMESSLVPRTTLDSGPELVE